MARAVKKGYRHLWNYHSSLWDETKKKDKYGKTYWKVRWGAIKSKRSKSYGGFPKGFRGKWSLKGVQRIVKTGKGRYRTVFTGIKRPIKFYSPKYKKRKYRRKY